MFDYTTATRDQKEEFLQDKILICLQATKQPMTNAQIREYLLKHVYELPANVTKLTTSKKGSVYSDFQIRVNMSITSLYKGGLVDHPKRGVTELTQLGKSINLNTGRKHMHKLIVEGWQK